MLRRAYSNDRHKIQDDNRYSIVRFVIWRGPKITEAVKWLQWPLHGLLPSSPRRLIPALIHGGSLLHALGDLGERRPDFVLALGNGTKVMPITRRN